MGTFKIMLLHHAYSLLFGWVLLEQAGMPVPSIPVMLAAGTLSAAHKMNFVVSVLAILVASLIADSAWYWLGRRDAIRGWNSWRVLRRQRIRFAFASDARYSLSCSPRAQLDQARTELHLLNRRLHCLASIFSPASALCETSALLWQLCGFFAFAVAFLLSSPQGTCFSTPAPPEHRTR